MPSRLFLALAPDAETRDRLARVAERVRLAAGDTADALRWVRPEHLHVTLIFIGTVADDLRDRLIHVLDRPVPFPPIAAAVDAIGTFPGAGPPRVVWLSVTPGGAIGRVRDAVGERLTALGVTTESRPFSPHVTLARVRDAHRRRVHDLRARVETVRVPADRWPIDRVTLFESDLSGSAPSYRALQHTMLAAP